MMILIFGFSSTPAQAIPFFGVLDILVKKGGHLLGYAMLGLAYYFALPPRLSRGYRLTMAWLMALLFALSDEYHQSFVSGRSSSLVDVLIDSVGAGSALTIFGYLYSSNSNSKSGS
jgi:VanZ family protein